MHDVLIKRKVLHENDEVAAANRKAFRERGVFAVNIVSAPGAGKTALIERSAPFLKERPVAFAVIEGDIATDLDSRRIANAGVPVRQITTGKACHLDARMIKKTLPWIKSLDGIKLLIIENVGNLVCPAEFDLGEELTVAVLGAAEGEDKPLKYPSLFSSSDALVINKTDLIPFTDFNIDKARENALCINPHLRIFETSCRTGEGIEEFAGYIAGLVEGGF